MEATHQMEGSLHLIGQVVTPHQTKKKRYVGLILKVLYLTSVPKENSTKKDRLAWIEMQENKENSMLSLQVSHYCQVWKDLFKCWVNASYC